MAKEKPATMEVQVWRQTLRDRKVRWVGRCVLRTSDGQTVRSTLGRSYANVQAVRRAARAKWPLAAKACLITLTKAA